MNSSLLLVAVILLGLAHVLFFLAIARRVSRSVAVLLLLGNVAVIVPLLLIIFLGLRP